MSTPDVQHVDPAMMELFQAEMDTHIPVLSGGLLALERGDGSAAAAPQVEAMMRAAHSIKGAARIVGIEPAVRVSHLLEDCFTAAKEGRVTLTGDNVDLLLQGVDALQRICAPPGETPVAEANLDELLSGLTLLKSGQSPAARSPGVGTVSTLTPPASEAGRVTVQPEEPNVTVPGVFDEGSLESLRKQLLAARSAGAARVRLDFAQVGELSAGALALLASFARESVREQPAAAAVTTIESRRMCPAVRTVLRVAGLDAAFGIER